MEPLRIRIPDIYYCSTEDCYRLSRQYICKQCISNIHSDARMRQEVSPTTLPSEPKVVHSTPFRGFLSG
jgi:hypothetical protein